jgi:hypothetical protein
MSTDHKAYVLGMNSQFEQGNALSLDRTNLHVFRVVHESLGDHL